MQMKVNGAALRQLREARSWSQQHLAAAAGLGLRTVQRMEAQGSASPDSRLAVAAALNVPVETLSPRPAPAPAAAAGPSAPPAVAQRFRRGMAYGYAGVALGAAAAATGVLAGQHPPSHMGVLLGTVGAVAGLCCAVIGVLSRRLQTRA